MVVLLVILATVTVAAVVLMIVVREMSYAHRQQYMEDLAAAQFPGCRELDFKPQAVPAPIRGKKAAQSRPRTRQQATSALIYR